MTPTDPVQLVAADGGIITRSDRVPTTYERYGHWARKFFGAGYEQAHKDCTGMSARRPDAATRASRRH